MESVEHPDFIEPVQTPNQVQTPVQTLANDDFLAEDVEGQLNKSLNNFSDRINQLKEKGYQSKQEATNQNQQEEVDEDSGQEEYSYDGAVPEELVYGLYSALGFEFDPEQDRFENLTDFYDFIRATVEQNIAANQNRVFANKQIYQLNELAKRGIPIEEYLRPQGTINYREQNPVDLLHYYNTKLKGLSEDESVARLQNYDSSNVLMREYELVLKELEHMQAQQVARHRQELEYKAAQREQEYQRTQAYFYNYFNSYKDILNNPVDQDTADYMFRAVYQQYPDGETLLQKALKDPDKLATLAWLEATADPNGNWNFNRILTQADKSASARISQSLKRTVSRPATNQQATTNNQKPDKPFYDDERYYRMSK